MPSSKTTTKSQRQSARRTPRKKRPLARAAKAVVSFLTDPDYPHKTATKKSRHRGELIA
jgi:hypothetical protein